MNKMYTIKNRSASNVVYRIPEDGIRREFAPGEVKKVSQEELVKLSYQPGGRELVQNFLQLTSVEAIQDVGIHAEPEYHMSEAEVIELIKTGSLDAFLDCLDFAPVGVIDLVKKYSVSIPLSDYSKRQALKLKTGFDVDAALRHMQDDPEEETAAKTTAGSITPGRRTSGEKYTIIKKAENSAE